MQKIAQYGHTGANANADILPAVLFMSQWINMCYVITVRWSRYENRNELGTLPRVKYERQDSQCDQILRNFVTLASF